MNNKYKINKYCDFIRQNLSLYIKIIREGWKTTRK